MNAQQAIEKLYRNWEDQLLYEQRDPSGFIAEFGKKDRKKMFLATAIFGLVTSDPEMDAELGGGILETMNHIQEGTNHEYAEDQSNFRNYLMCINLIIDWVDYGSDIRAAWFEPFEVELTPALSLEAIGYSSESIPLTEELLEWFLSFLNQSEEFLDELHAANWEFEKEQVIKDATESLNSLKNINQLLAKVQSVIDLKNLNYALQEIKVQMLTVQERHKEVSQLKAFNDLREQLQVADTTIKERLERIAN